MRAWLQTTVVVTATAIACTAIAGEPVFEQVNLVADQPGLAYFTDPSPVNPWGLAASPTGEWWIANNNSDSSTLYRGDGAPLAARVAVPGHPTGQVFYGGSRFIVSDVKGHVGPARFIFAAEDGTVSAWSPALPPSTRATIVYDGSDDGDIYKGLALASDRRGRGRLFATDFHNNRVVVLDDEFVAIDLGKRAFTDSALPSGYAPFGITAFGNRIFVTYALQDDEAKDDVVGPGHGFIDEYDVDGRFVHRIASRGPLNSPWGLSVAPRSFGRFAETLLVGNFGDGRIHAYRQWTNGQFTLEGTIADQRGLPIVIPGLWAIVPGNDGRAGSSKDLYFTAGPDDELHGLFGLIRRSSDQLVGR